MSERLIDRVRAKFPQYADVPDDKLTLAIGTKFPAYLERDAKFAANFEAFGQMQANTADSAAAGSVAGERGLLKGTVDAMQQGVADTAGAVDERLIRPLTGATSAEWAASVPEAARLTVTTNPLKTLGRGFTMAGDVLANDVRRATGLTSLDPAGPVAQGLQDVGRSVPVLGASMALQRLGVNPAVAFGSPPAAQTFAETGDAAATMKAGAVGALIPAVAQAGRLGGAALNRALIERNLLAPTANATQKAVEILGSQGAVQVFMEGLKLPEYAALDPEQRREAIFRSLVANTAFLGLDLPAFRRSVPSETMQRMAPAERVAYALRDAAANPELVDALHATADELALQATQPGAGSGEQGATIPNSDFRLPTSEPGRPLDVFDTFQGINESVSEDGFTPIDQAVARNRLGRMDPAAGIAEAVPAEGWTPIESEIRRQRLMPRRPAAEPTEAAPTITTDQRKASQEFDRLLAEVGPELGWMAPGAMLDGLKGGLESEGSIKAKVLRGAELAKARRAAAQQFGADPDNLDLTQRAALLPQLQEFVAQEVIPQRQAESLTAAIQPEAGKQPVNTSDLAVGDVLNIDGERVRVDAVDPDTGEVTLQDGTKFGRTVVADGQTLYVENVEPVEASTEFAPVEQKATEGTKAADFRKVAKEWSKTLPDSDVDSKRGNNVTDAPWDKPFVDGTLTADRYGDDPYIYEDRWVDPKSLLYNDEGRTYQQIVDMPTTQKYIEWYKQGFFGPPVSVVFNGPANQLKSINRRRIVAAIEAGIDRIPGRVELGKASQVMAARPAGNGPEGLPAPRSPLPASPVLDAPESVADQNARLEREAAQAKTKADREKLAERQAKPLTGSVGDIGQGDLLGGGDLFSAPTPRGAAGSPRQPQGTFGLPAIPAGAATATPAGRMVVTMERLVPGFTTVARLEQRLRAIVDSARGLAEASPIRSGRLSRRFAGQFAEPSRVIRVWDRMNLPVTAHEVAHALADAIFGTAASRGLRGIPLAAGRELVRMGRALYGNQMPVSGYAAEGWAELVADYLTTDDIARRAPEATRWLEGTVMPAFPEVAAAMRQARAEIDVWRGMGARERMRAQTGQADGKLARLRRELGRYASREGFVEQFAPYEALSRRFRQVAGRALRADDDPFQIATARRGQAGAILAYMADEGMIDPAGNRTGGRSLREALAPVTHGLRADQILARRQRSADFWAYLWSRRAIERWGLDRNPGISLADAQYLRQTLETPDFQLAASRYYEWWDGVLDYLGASSPANAELVRRIRAGSKDYVPLARVLDANQSRPGENQGVGGALRRMRGSSLPVKELDVQTLLAAEQVISRAHRDQVMESIFHLAQQPGMGGMIEEVPRARVQEQVNIERLRLQLEGMGVDTTNIPADTLLEYYTGADQPTGSDPIVARQVNGQTRWYYVRPDLFGALEGIQPARLPLVADLLLGVPARTFRLGTTGLRPAFSLFTNPARDLQTFLMQSTAGANPLRRVAEYFGALGDVVRSGLTGQPSAYRDLFDRLGVMAGQPLGGDVGFARRSARGLFHGQVFRRVTAPIETLRELLSFTEAVPRIAELRLRSRELGWAPGQPLTPEQALALTIAAKRVTTDFSAGGSYAKLWSQAIPFFNANIQGTRGFLRALRERPVQATLYGLSLFTVPALYSWWQNKDEDWYRALPWRERYLYWNVPDGKGNVFQIPRPPEWQNLFAVMPEALFDSAYRDNPEAFTAAFGHLFATANPFDLPVLGRIGWEQARNHMDFFDRPIVPRAQVDLRPGEQVGPYTSWLAQSLGKAFPDKVSPRRVDHLLRGVGGGAASDTLAGLEQALGLRPGSTRQELSEIPVVGKAARRGGEFSAVNRQLSELYDLHYYWQARARNKELAPHLRAYANMLEGRMEGIRLAQRIAEQTDDLKARQSIYRDLTRQAELLLGDAKRIERLPSQQ